PDREAVESLVNWEAYLRAYRTSMSAASVLWQTARRTRMLTMPTNTCPEARPMNEIVLTILLTVAALILLRLLLVIILAGVDLGRIALTIRSSSRTLRDPEFAGKVRELLDPKPPRPSGEAVRLFALLQRDGRLLDFLLEDVKGYSNEQIGAAVRDIHRNCQH